MKFFKPQTTDPEVGSIITNIISSIGNSTQVDTDEDIGEYIKGYDIMEFIDDLYDFLNQYQAKMTTFKDFDFKPESTYRIPSDNESNSLRYSIKNRTYASMQQGFSQHNGRKDFKWRLRDIIEDKDQPGYKAMVFDKTFDNTLILTSWSKNYRDANKFAFELENIMDTYKGLFKLKGLVDIRYEGRGDDIFKETSNYGWYGCPMEFYVRTTQVRLVYEKILEQMTIELSLQNK